MKYAIILFCITSVLLKQHSCWIINDLNAKMLAGNSDADNNTIPALGKQLNLIFPGTKWCGAGDIADSNEDLGSEKEADMCCRDHDNCPDVIPGGETNHNLTNNVFYSRLSCACDDAFRNCLTSAGTHSAKIIGNIYFNALQTKCFRKDYPVVGCKKRGGWFKKKCLEYSYDTNGEKIYQWFDEQDF